jgi:HNH endonuclease
MRHFVAYHSAEKMGYEYEPIGEYAFFSRKALTILERTIGSMVWVINGSRSKARNMTYTLCAVYTPDEVVDANEAEFDYIVAGTVGHDFDPPIELNHLPWFAGFFKSQSNFSFGINEIKDSTTIDYLSTLAKSPDVERLTSTDEISFPLDLDILDVEALEGMTTYVSHLRRERNRAVTDAKKEQTHALHGRLVCEACGFDFSAFYGKLGEGYCEVHHKIPLASLDGKRVTKLDDLAIVCSNCHRMIHRKTPMPSVSELKALIYPREA